MSLVSSIFGAWKASWLGRPAFPRHSQYVRQLRHSRIQVVALLLAIGAGSCWWLMAAAAAGVDQVTG